MSTKEQVDEVKALMNDCQQLAADVGNACFEGDRTELRGLGAAWLARRSRCTAPVF